MRKESWSYGQHAAFGALPVSAHSSRERLEHSWKDAKERENVNVVFVASVYASNGNQQTQGTQLQFPAISPHRKRAIHTSLRKNREPLFSAMLIPRKAFGALTFALCVAGLFFFSNSIVQWSVYLFGSKAPLIPYTTHVVLFQFKETTTSFAIKEITSKFYGLKKSCVQPDTRRPYILSITGGIDTSLEGMQNGMSHAFILKFSSQEERDYYVKEDPAHQAFKDAATAVVEKTIVVDFQEGVFFNA